MTDPMANLFRLMETALLSCLFDHRLLADFPLYHSQIERSLGCLHCCLNFQAGCCSTADSAAANLPAGSSAASFAASSAAAAAVAVDYYCCLAAAAAGCCRWAAAADHCSAEFAEHYSAVAKH